MNRTAMVMLAMASLTACSTTRAPRDYLTPSEALARASELDGSKVTIGGVVDLGTNSRCLYDSMEAIRDRKGDGARVVTLSGGDRLLKRRAELNHHFVLVSGTFKRLFHSEPEEIDLYQCNDAGIAQDTVRLARP